MGALGFLGIRYDPQYGGQGLDYWYDTIFLEELGHIKALGLSVAIAVQTHMATPAIAEFGSGYLKETYLKPAGLDETKEISMGKVVAGQLLTEVADGCLQMYGGLGFMK